MKMGLSFMTKTEYILDDCLAVAERSDAERVGILVFASHKRYGGGYRNHSRAQEEYLFNKTTLPLQDYPEAFYALSHDEAGGFFTEAHSKITGRKFIFIFVPAPVWNLKHWDGNEDRRYAVLQARAKLIFELAQDAKVDHLILGGWGCGVFKCPPKLVSETLKKFTPNGLKITYAFLDEKIKNVFEDKST